MANIPRPLPLLFSKITKKNHAASLGLHSKRSEGVKSVFVCVEVCMVERGEHERMPSVQWSLEQEKNNNNNDKKAKKKYSDVLSYGV